MKLASSLAVTFTSMLLTVPMGAHAEWQPKGPITMMIAFAAGGGADTQARLIAEELEARKGWRIIPQTVAGKGGAVLAVQLAKQPADGTAIGMIVSDTVTYSMLAEKTPGYTEKDFTYLTTTAGTQIGLVARSDKGWKTLADVTAAIKSGEKISFGAMSQKLADGAYLLGKQQNVQYNIVSFKGGKAVLNALNAGDVDVGWVAGIQARGVAAGDLVNLASAERKRLVMSPEVPTIAELGLAQHFGVSFLFAAPKGLPADARSALTSAITEVIKDPTTKAHAYITKSFGGPLVVSGTDLDQALAADLVSAAKLLEDVSK